MITFRIDRSGTPPYQQLVAQVRQAITLGFLRAGDQLPLIREVSADLAINPNTVAKAYRELEVLGIVEGRPGVGTFVAAHDATVVSPGTFSVLARSLTRWFERARDAGLDDTAIDGLIATVRHRTDAENEGAA